jgi:hypothetical protein
MTPIRVSLCSFFIIVNCWIKRRRYAYGLVFFDELNN